MESIDSEKKPFLTIKRKQLLFYTCVVGLPVIQFLIFYVFVNINSIILAFQEYDYTLGEYSFIGFNNFKNVFRDTSHDAFLSSAIINSVPVWLLNTFVALPFSLFVGFYIYKKMLFHKVLMWIQILPSMVSSLIFTLIFKYLADRAVPAIWELITGKQILGLLANVETQFPTLIFWGFWNALTGNFLMVVGTMNGSVDASVIESAQLDGCTLMGEFIYIAIPCIFPMITVWLTNAVSGFFGVSVGQIALYGTSAPSDVYTLGYYMYVKLQGGSFGTYPYLSALGLCMTLIAFPLVFGIRKLLEKYGPSPD